MESAISLKTFLNPRYWYAWPVLGSMMLLSWMPRSVLWVLGSAIGWLFYWLPSPACRIAARNIELCFQDRAPSERRSMVQAHFRLCGFAVLCLGVGWWAPKWRIKRFIKLHNSHYVHDAYARGKNVILLAPHFIALDIGGIRTSIEKTVVTLYRKARNPLIEYMFQRRTRFGAVTIERLASLKPIIRHIREGMPFYYLPDQDMGERASVFVPFFGIPTATVMALSRIAQITNAEVVPCITRLMPKGRGIEVTLHPALENFPTDDPEADARRMNEEIEKWVREMPEQYMWSYRRFKTRPNNEPSLYGK